MTLKIQPGERVFIMCHNILCVVVRIVDIVKYVFANDEIIEILLSSGCARGSTFFNKSKNNSAIVYETF